MTNVVSPHRHQSISIHLNPSTTRGAMEEYTFTNSIAHWIHTPLGSQSERGHVQDPSLGEMRKTCGCIFKKSSRFFGWVFYIRLKGDFRGGGGGVSSLVVGVAGVFLRQFSEMSWASFGNNWGRNFGSSWYIFDLSFKCNFLRLKCPSKKRASSDHKLKYHGMNRFGSDFLRRDPYDLYIVFIYIHLPHQANVAKYARLRDGMGKVKPPKCLGTSELTIEVLWHGEIIQLQGWAPWQVCPLILWPSLSLHRLAAKWLGW